MVITKRSLSYGKTPTSGSSGSSSPQTLTTAQKNAGMRIERSTDSSGNKTYSSPTNLAGEVKVRTPETNIVETSNLGADAANTKIKFPQFGDTQNYTGILNGMQSLLNPDGTAKTDAENISAQNSARILQQEISSMLSAKNDMPTQEELYAKAQKETGILQKQQEVSNYQGQLNQIVAGAQANQLAVTGQGRGIPEAIIGGQQAQIAKEAAIAALPVAAQLSAAQGNLEMAQQNLTTLFNIKAADAKNEYDFKINVIDKVSQFATKQEENQLARVRLLETRKYEEEKATSDQLKAIAIEAAKNGASASTLTAISNAKTFSDGITAAGPSLVTPNTQVIKLDNGSTMLIDQRTGRVIKDFGGAAPDGGITLPNGTSEQVKGLATIGTLVGGFSSVNAQKMFLQNISDLAVKGDERGIAEKVIGQTLANIPDSDQRKKATGGFLLSQQLTGLQKLLDDYEASGGKTDIFRGSIQAAYQRVGLVGDPKLANLGTQILNQLDNLARTRTGAVISPSEEKLYARLLPGIGKVGDLNREVISGLKTSLMTDVENNLRYNITSDGVQILKSTLPDVFDYQDNFLGSFSPTSPSASNSLFFNSIPL